MKTQNSTTSFLLAGVGGQGTLLASNVLAQVGVKAGYDVKKAEVHGMAQRGGSVSSHVRWGEILYSPLIGQGQVDYLVAFEKLEALRYLAMLRSGAMAIVGETRIPPLTVSSGDHTYPDDQKVRDAVHAITDALYLIPSLTLAREAGNPRTHNVVVLGALSRFVSSVPMELWLEVIEEWVPKRHIEVNRQAFLLGREASALKS
jgi:indolepyruvate ferredoxin oxidoreductase beta subunit